MCFDGVALTWFKELPVHIQDDYEDLKGEFVRRLNNPDLKWTKELKLLERRQKAGESVDDYLDDINHLCSRLEKSSDERMSIILRGLRPEIRKFVIGKRPSSLSDMLSWARLAFELDIGEESAVSSLLLQETQNLRHDIMALNYEAGRPWGRSRGTTDGQIVCCQCNKVGHHQQNCWSNPRPLLRCFYCDIPGHRERECRKKQRDQERRYDHFHGRSRSNEARQNGYDSEN